MDGYHADDDEVEIGGRILWAIEDPASATFHNRGARKIRQGVFLALTPGIEPNVQRTSVYSKDYVGITTGRLRRRYPRLT